MLQLMSIRLGRVNTDERARINLSLSRAAELGHPAAMTMSVTGHKNESQMYADYSQSCND